MRPPADLLDRLSHFRLAADLSRLAARPGERRSRAKGAGLEFAGHRPYREGDDLRHLDMRVYARTGVPFLREYAEDRQLRVSILVDTSLSMEFGTPAKREVAKTLAGLLGYAGLASGDLVDVGFAKAGRIHWSDAMQGPSFADTLFRWIEANATETDASFPTQLKAALPRLRTASLAILIGDFWLDDVDRDLASLRQMSGQVYALHLITPEDEDPLRLGGGPMRLSDVETGAAVEIEIDATAAQGYGELLTAYRHSLQTSLERIGGRYLPLRSDASAHDMFRQMVTSGLLGASHAGAKA